MKEPILSWIKQLGSSSGDEATSIAVDQWGNVFICGYTDGALEEGQDQGHSDAFLAKYTAKGEQAWVKQLGSSTDDGANSIAVDQWGNVFICGGMGIVLEEGRAPMDQDVLLAKYTSKGEQAWVKQLGSASWDGQLGSSSWDGASSIAVDPWGNVFICGYTDGALEEGQDQGQRDAFLAKYTAKGEQAWVKQLGSASWDEANSIAIDQWGNVFICGSTGGADGALEEGQAQGRDDAFLAKYTAKGEQAWVKQLGSSSYDGAFSIAVDQWGNVFICGYTQGALEEGQAQGRDDAFLAKYTAKGEQAWVKQLGSASRDGASSIAVDQWGNVFICGYTDGALEEGQDQGHRDAFLAKYTAKGEQAWVKQLGSSSDDGARSIAVDQWGHVFICGSTFGHLEEVQDQWGADAFLAKYVDDLSVTQHHLLVLKRLDQLSNEVAQLKEELYAQNMDLSLIGLANEYTKGRAGNKISIAETRKLINAAEDSNNVISAAGKKTLSLIYAKYDLTAGAETLLLKALLSE